MSFRDRLTLDPQRGEHRDGAMRYMLLKPEALMGIALHLPDDMRPAVFQAMADSVFAAGGASARAYRASGARDGDALLATIAETAPQLGWGIWTFVRTSNTITLEVENSPFAQGHGPSDHPVCAMIVGMLRAVGGMVLDTEVQVREIDCAAIASSHCRFHITT